MNYQLIFSGEAAAGNGKQKKNVVADRRNRQALGDIGNLVTVVVGGKPQPQISRPITRLGHQSLYQYLVICQFPSPPLIFIFCFDRGYSAQLMAKAKEAAAAENNKVHLSNHLFLYSLSILEYRIRTISDKSF